MSVYMMLIGKSSVPTDQSFPNHEDLNDLLEFLEIEEPVV